MSHRIRITYCVPGDYSARAVGVAGDLLATYQNVIDDLVLVTGANGVFDVVVDDTIIYSKTETGRHAEPGEVLDLFTANVGPDVARYGEHA